MDEQRLEAYINLIEELLNCPKGEESEILNANRELVDAQFLEVVAQVAEQLEAEGDRDKANFLRHLGSQLIETLGISETPTSANPSFRDYVKFLDYVEFLDYVKFLDKVLLATDESDGNSEVIYPLLKANLDKLDNNLIAAFQKALQIYTPERFPICQ